MDRPKNLKRSRGDAEEVREISKISLRPLRLKVFGGMNVRRGLALLPNRFSNISSRPPMEDERICVFDDISFFVFRFPWVKTHGY